MSFANPRVLKISVSGNYVVLTYLYFYYSYLVYYRFMNPAIVTPDDYEMADSVSNLQRTNLINVSFGYISYFILYSVIPYTVPIFVLLLIYHAIFLLC